MHRLIDPALGLDESHKGIDPERLVKRSVNNLEWLDSGCTLAVVENARCPHHFHLPIQYFCLDCRNGEGCFCSECALSKHANCDVRTLKEAHAAILNTVICKWTNQLAARAENLDVVFAQLLLDKREVWATKLQELHSILLRTTSDLEDTLRETENGLVQWLKDSHAEFVSDYETVRNKTHEVLESHVKNAATLRQQRRLPVTKLLHFYNENYPKLRQMLLGLTPRDSDRVAQAECKHLSTKLDAMNKCTLQVAEMLARLDHYIRHNIEATS